MSTNTSSASAYNSSDTYNGTHTDKYSWTQNIIDLDVKIPVGPLVKKGKDVVVDIQTNHLRVSVIDGDNTEVLVDGQLTESIVKDESYWNLTPGQAVYIYYQKQKEKWWTALIEGETPIDMKSIEAVRPMEDLEDEEQMKIAELMWNQEQKQKGLPTSDQLKMQDILKKAWEVEGSPFKGTPFDPSKVQFSTDSTHPPPQVEDKPPQEGGQP